MAKELDVGDIIDAIPVDSRDGLIQVVKIGSPWNFAVQYAPGSNDEMVNALKAIEEKFPSQEIFKSSTMLVLRDRR